MLGGGGGGNWRVQCWAVGLNTRPHLMFVCTSGQGCSLTWPSMQRHAQEEAGGSPQSVELSISCYPLGLLSCVPKMLHP